MNGLFKTYRVLALVVGVLLLVGTFGAVLKYGSPTAVHPSSSART